MLKVDRTVFLWLWIDKLEIFIKKKTLKIIRFK